MVFRSDRGGLAAPVNATIFEGRAARTHAPGDGLQYDTGPEYRDSFELQKIVTQLPGTSIYRPHPNTFPAAQSGQKAVGRVLSARVDGGAAVVSMAITDPETVAAVQAGERELSLGYTCDLDPESRYQRSTSVDHLAIVDRARCGDTCSMRADCQGPGTAGHVDTIVGPAVPHPSETCTCKNHTMLNNGEVDSITTQVEDAELTAKARHALAAKQFAIPSREGLPIQDEAHVRAAMARFGEEHFSGPAEKQSAYHRILARAHELGIDPAGFEKKWANRLDDEDNTMDELKTKLDAALADVAAQKARADQAETALTAEKARADLAEATAQNARKDADAEKARAEAAIAAQAEFQAQARKDAASQLDTQVAERVALVTAATAVLGADAKIGDKALASADPRAIRVAVIKHVDGDDIATEKSDQYVEGLYEGALRRHARSAGSRTDARIALQQLRTDGAATINKTTREIENEARAKMTNRVADAWNQE